MNSLEMNFSSTIYEVSGQLSPRKVTLRLGLRFGSVLELELGFGGNFSGGQLS